MDTRTATPSKALAPAASKSEHVTRLYTCAEDKVCLEVSHRKQQLSRRVVLHCRRKGEGAHITDRPVKQRIGRGWGYASDQKRWSWMTLSRMYPHGRFASSFLRTSGAGQTRRSIQQRHTISPAVRQAPLSTFFFIRPVVHPVAPCLNSSNDECQIHTSEPFNVALQAGATSRLANPVL